jgi:hypothetical protein
LLPQQRQALIEARQMIHSMPLKPGEAHPRSQFNRRKRATRICFAHLQRFPVYRCCCLTEEWNCAPAATKGTRFYSC